MAEQIEYKPLSGSTNGEPIHITATTSGGAHTLHTATTRGFDLVDVYADNQHSGAVVVSFELGGTGVTKQLDISITNDLTMGDPILSSVFMAGGITLKAFAATTAVINIIGLVKRYD